MNAFERSGRRIANLVQRQRPADTSWYRIRNAADGQPTRVDIYDEIGGSWLFGGVTAADFVAELAAIAGDLEVHINSPGGDVFDGLAIYNSLAQRPGRVVTVVDGLAASAASFIAQAGTERVIAPGAMMMIHDASGMCMGNASDMRELADLLDKVSDNLASIYADRTGRADGWRDAMKAETWYTADEAVAAGLAHRVAERPAEDEALTAVARFDLSVYAHVPDRLKAAAAADSDGQEQKPVAQQEQPARVLGVETMPIVDKALPIHHTATEDSAWDGPAAVAAMPNDAAVLEYCHAWMDSAADDGGTGDDPDGDADDKKSSYRFPHHRTKGGAANIPACRNGLARLEGSTIPEADKAGVRAHLQAHLDDANKGDEGDEKTNHAGLPGWLHDHEAGGLPAWLMTAEEANTA